MVVQKAIIDFRFKWSILETTKNYFFIVLIGQCMTLYYTVILEFKIFSRPNLMNWHGFIVNVMLFVLKSFFEHLDIYFFII